MSQSVSNKSILRSIAYMGMCFSLIYTGFNVAQSFTTLLFPGSIGFIILTLTSACFSLSALFASSIHLFLKHRLSKWSIETLIISTCSYGYFIYVLSLLSKSSALVMAAAVIAGVLGGQFWANQGIYLTKLSGVEILGTATGIFFTVYNINGILGNLIAILLIKFQINENVLLGTMALVSLLGCILLVLLKPFNDEFTSNTARITTATDAIDDVNNPMTGGVFSVGGDANQSSFTQFLRKRETLLLIPYILIQGTHLSFSFGNLPLFVKAYLPSSQLIITIDIPLVFLLYSIGCFIGSFTWGKLYDKCNSKLFLMIFLHVIFVLVSYTILIILGTSPVVIKSPKAALYSVGFIFGLNDYLVNAIVNQSTSKIYRGPELSMAFSWYRFLYCVGYSVASIASGYLPAPSPLSHSATTGFQKYGWMIVPLVNICLLVPSAVSGLYLDSNNPSIFPAFESLESGKTHLDNAADAVEEPQKTEFLV